MSFGRRFLITAAAVAGVLLGTRAQAQTPTTPSPPQVTAGWNDGFVIQSIDGDNRLQLGVILQADGRLSFDDPRPITNTFLMRKARPVFSGRVSRYFDFKVMPEFAGGSAQLLDAYFDIRFSNAFRIRSGKDKTPVGYELLLGDTTLIFPERSVVSLLVPNRDVGFQVLGEVAGGKVLYQGGIFNGQPVDGASSTTDADANDSKDVAGRIVVLPFKSTTTPASLLDNFGFHLGASTGDQTGPLPSFRTSVGQAVFNYASATADGRRNRITPAVFIYTQGFGAYAEYARTRQDIIIRNEERTTIVNHAWQVTASYVLTGEAVSDRGVKPRAPFDPAAGHWGALQVAARYGELTLDDAIFASGIAGPNAIRRARQVTATIDWFLTNYIKIYGAFERFTFNEGSRDAEHSVIFRTQLAF